MWGCRGECRTRLRRLLLCEIVSRDKSTEACDWPTREGRVNYLPVQWEIMDGWTDGRVDDKHSLANRSHSNRGPCFSQGRIRPVDEDLTSPWESPPSRTPIAPGGVRYLRRHRVRTLWRTANEGVLEGRETHMEGKDVQRVVTAASPVIRANNPIIQ